MLPRNKMMIQGLFKSTVAILSSVAFLAPHAIAKPPRAKTTPPQPSANIAVTNSGCALGEGLWALSTGELECRHCPQHDDLQSGAILKMPMGCSAPIFGGFLEMDYYYDLKASEEYCNDLEDFKNKLSPSLQALSSNIDDLVVKTKQAETKFVDALTRLQTEKEANAKLVGQNYILIGSTVFLGVTSILSFVILYHTKN